jgi:hypothetical protein
LPLAEFTYNNAPNATTGVLPLFANKGYNPSIAVHLECDLASTHAQEFVTDLSELHQEEPFTLCKRTINTPQIRIDFQHLT